MVQTRRDHGKSRVPGLQECPSPPTQREGVNEKCESQRTTRGKGVVTRIEPGA